MANGLKSSQSDIRLQTLARLMRGYIFEALISSDHAVEFTWADDDFADLFDCERQEINKRGWESFVDPRDREAVAQRLTSVALGAKATLELRIISALGRQRWLRMAAEPVHDSVGGFVTGMIGVAEDITDRKVLLEQIFEAVNREQRRIGTDLHDELGQVLTGVSLSLKGCHTSALRGLAVNADDIESVLELIARAIETTRILAHGLAPGILGQGGFASALENLTVQARKWSGLTIKLSTRAEDVDGIDDSVADHLFRIVQEAITNVARHATARVVEISTRIDNDDLVVEIIDDGIGYTVGAMQGFGLRSMQYRADAIGANLKHESVRPHGARICVRLPRRFYSLGMERSCR